MKTLFPLTLLMFVFIVGARADVWVDPYTKKDGTYVDGYYRSDPNGTKEDNWSSKGNINPYTGKEGTKDPYSSGGSYSGGYGSYGSGGYEFKPFGK